MHIAAGVLSDKWRRLIGLCLESWGSEDHHHSSVSVVNMVDVIKTIPILAPYLLNLKLSYPFGQYLNCDETCQRPPNLPLESWEVRTYVLEYISCDYWNLCLYMYSLYIYINCFVIN